jgi:hypothetical protein
MRRCEDEICQSHRDGVRRSSKPRSRLRQSSAITRWPSWQLSGNSTPNCEIHRGLEARSPISSPSSVNLLRSRSGIQSLHSSKKKLATKMPVECDKYHSRYREICIQSKSQKLTIRGKLGEIQCRARTGPQRIWAHGMRPQCFT